jgi:hypothetical protein
MEKSWKVMFNSGQYQWGVNEKMEPMWNPNYDVVDLEVPTQKIDTTVEKFTIAFDNTIGDLNLSLAWDNTRVAIPIKKVNSNENETVKQNR